MASSAAISGVALPGTALRVTRTAAGRRALRVAFLVGGLFALGLLFGEQAHAVDGKAPTTPAPVVQTVTSSVTKSVTSSVAESVSGSVGQFVDPGGSAPGASETSSVSSSPVTHVTDAVRAHLTDTVRTPVTGTVDGVVQPVGDLAATVTGGLTETLTDTVTDTLTEVLTGALTPIPAEPSAEAPPSEPGPPTLPGTDEQTLPAAGSAAPRSGGAARDTSGSTDSADKHGAARRQAVAGTGSAYGPVRVGTRAGGTGVPRAADQGVRRAPVPAPAHRTPPGDPTGVPAHQSAGDNGGPRHGDPHAVTSHHRVPLRLVPGASVAVTVVETRDRFRDIPVFPG
ncbi:hypothetical protein [Streptomyces sp. NPDC050535]|uniref:hypothetical protein n=1 Tax=Streptomyces sp. NPDC050535 TaxID=3365626 RepID=UPI0037894D87